MMLRRVVLGVALLGGAVASTDSRADPKPDPKPPTELSAADTAKLVGFFYKRLQYNGSVNQAKRAGQLPLPETMNVLSRNTGHASEEQS